jgi:uncharacterized protein
MNGISNGDGSPVERSEAEEVPFVCGLFTYHREPAPDRVRQPGCPEMRPQVPRRRPLLRGRALNVIAPHSVVAVRRARCPGRTLSLAALLLALMAGASLLHACASGSDQPAGAAAPEATLPSEPVLPPGADGDLLQAAALGDIFRVEELLDEGADVNARTSTGATALMGALYNRFPRTAELLIARGADVNARSDRGRTALHQAAWEGYAEIATLLLRRGADPDARADDRTTPLMWAAMKGRVAVARVLIAGGADIDATSSAGATAESLALQSGHRDVARALQTADGKN